MHVVLHCKILTVMFDVLCCFVFYFIGARELGEKKNGS